MWEVWNEQWKGEEQRDTKQDNYLKKKLNGENFIQTNNQIQIFPSHFYLSYTTSVVIFSCDKAPVKLAVSVGWLVGWSVGLWGKAFIRRSTRRTFLAYLALFSKYFHNQILARSLTKW